MTWLRPLLARLWYWTDVVGAKILLIISEIIARAIPALRRMWRQLRDRVAALKPGTIRKLAIAGGVALLGLYAASFRDKAWHWYDTFQGNRPLMAAQSWTYHLDKIDADKIAQSTADVLVIDTAKNEGRVPLTKAEVAKLKLKPDGKPRLVLSYMSIGEAETYRWYWRDYWKGDDMPGWQVAENCAWPRAHMVKFWHDGWKDIIYAGRQTYIKRIIDAGFDGVYLDNVDVYHRHIQERPSAREDMIDFVRDLAAVARKMKPGLLVVAQNAEDLLEERRYRDIIDGVGKEDLLFGKSGTGVRNSEKDIAQSLERLQLLQADYKPVFAVEYLTTKDAIAGSTKELNSFGMVPTFQNRSLDGGDPTVPRAEEKQKYGTPEWIAANCKDKPHW